MGIGSVGLQVRLRGVGDPGTYSIVSELVDQSS